MKKYLFPAAFLPLLLVSCTKEIDLDLPQQESKISMDGRFSVGDSIQVLVGTSSSILGNGEPSADNLSRVYLYVDGELADTLRPQVFETTIYEGFSDTLSLYRYHSQFLAEAGREYHIQAEREGIETATAGDFTPSTVELVDWKIDTAARRISFAFEDPAATQDYYLMEIQAENDGDAEPWDFTLTSYDPTVEMLYNTGSFQNAGASGRKAVLTDEFFNGERREMALYYDTALAVGREYVFRFSHITEDHYRYQRSRSAQEAGNSQVFKDPANLYGNVKNGYGAVVGSNTIRRVFTP